MCDLFPTIDFPPILCIVQRGNVLSVCSGKCHSPLVLGPAYVSKESAGNAGPRGRKLSTAPRFSSLPPLRVADSAGSDVVSTRDQKRHRGAAR